MNMHKKNIKRNKRKPLPKINLGLRRNDYVDYGFKREATFTLKVFRYDIDKYKDVTSFFDRFGYMLMMLDDHRLNEDMFYSIKDFLKIIGAADKYDEYSEVDFDLYSNMIWQEGRKEEPVRGTFQIDNYMFYATEYKLFFHKINGEKKYVYRGEFY